MNLTCPNCSTTFAVDAAKLGPTGKKVRCAKCAHVWHAEAPVTEERKQQVLEEQRQEVRKALQEKIVTEKKPAAAKPEPTESKKLINYLKIAASVLLLLNVGALLTFNKSIIGQTSFYDMIGQYDTKSITIDPNSSVASKAPKKGTDVVVNWSIKNTSGKAVTNPSVRIKLYDKNAELIGEKLGNSNGKKIAAGGTIKFKDSLIHKTKTGRYLTVEVGNNAELAAR
jgi:predicted Zn finger-like uncharacterized protein